MDQKVADIFQDTITEYLVAVQYGKYIEQGKFLAYFKSVAANIALNQYKQQQKLGDALVSSYLVDGQPVNHLDTARCNFFDTLHEKGPDLFELIDERSFFSTKQILLEKIRRASQLLSPKPKAVFDLWMQGCSLVKTAEILQLNVGNVKTIRSRLLTKLRLACN